MYQNYDTLMNDITFKEAFADIHNRRQLENFLETLLDYPKGYLKDKLSVSYESQIKKANALEKNSRTDIEIAFDDIILDLEAYSYLNQESVDKSTFYVMKISASKLIRGQEYKDLKVVQYNFVDDVHANIGPLLDNQFVLTHKDYPDIRISEGMFEIHYIRIDKVRELGYNENELIKWFRFIAAMGYKERATIAEGDELFVDFNKWIDEYVNDDITREAMAKWNKEIEANKYVEIAREQEKIKVAQKLLADDFPVDVISKYTDLSIEEIEKLKNK